MHSSKKFSHYKILLLISLLASSTCACSALLVRARTPQVETIQESKEHFSGKGVRITEIQDGSPAQSAGLKAMDVIFRYGDVAVVDHASYFAVREKVQNDHVAEVPVVVWRDGKALRIMVAPGSLGIDSNEYNPVAYEFSALMMRLDAQQEIPEDERDREFKDSYIPTAKILDEAKHIIDKAERESTLTPTQILVARIYMVLDDASPEDVKRQSEMLAQLTPAQPIAYIYKLGQKEFFEKNRNHAAIACFKRYLEVYPDDVSLRLNMGIAYYRIRMFSEAEAAADYVLDNKLGLSDHGYAVAYSVKGMGLLARRDYSNTILLAEKGFDLDRCECNIALVMLAAAETGDLPKLGQASSKFQQSLPEEFEQSKLVLAGVEALALVKNNQRDRARQLVQKFKGTGRVEGKLQTYWKVYPGGADIWTNWNELTRN